MMKTYSRSLLVAVFILGCVASHVAREVGPPRPASAQTASEPGAPATGPRYQYGCVEFGVFDDKDDVETGLNEWGALGWQLVTVSTPTSGAALYCFRQP